jgi:pimeloyl-ACP methyl ester carboxylesterase
VPEGTPLPAQHAGTPIHLVPPFRTFRSAPDPEWARAFSTGTVAASCDHAKMLAAVKVPVLYTHHLRSTDPESGALIGAASDQQAAYACELIRSAGQRVDYRSFPTMGHLMHQQDPPLFGQTLDEWASTL